ncbi:DUF475 domain-containing protein [Luteimicrobium subarcticum]|uniref:YkoY family integral membrane protein n=1 Tax=Luteimicrobium subarcticum TaxID=620910 RepID=A0A2M8WW11_9MICO|nr:DUF475 domain-containing protein [Luteimicrobium subarcticum]PJI95106.1 hypothetical protein CLV34_0959 [Luteimicrobium subarcticum]
MDALRHFKWDFVVLLAALGVAFWYGGTAALWLAMILVVVEIVFSFDNAAVNAKYLARLNDAWQRIFLTVGILIAVVGMRLVFPFVIVCLTGGVGPAEAIRLAFEKGDPHTPGTYGYILDQAHPAIAAFGGVFLLLLFLDFLFDTERDSTWLSWIEKPLLKVGKLDQLSVIVVAAVLLVASQTLAADDEQSTVLFAGVLGIVVYLAVNGLASVMEDAEAAKAEQLHLESDDEGATTSAGPSAGQQVLLAGKAAFSLFLFLEVLDASFSFDGVIGAFAITPDPVIIALGLGVGALFVRSMTVFLVKRGTLAEYRYLEHGAHWAIGSLALLLFVTLEFDIPDVVIGLVGIAFIGAALATSVVANRREAEVADAADEIAAEAAPAPGIFESGAEHEHAVVAAATTTEQDD